MQFSADDWTAIFLTIRIAGTAIVLGMPFAIAMALLLASKEFYGKIVLDGLVHLPLVLPPVVTGYFLLIGFGSHGIFGRALEQCCSITLAFRWTGAALAAAIMAFPLMVRAIRLSFEAVNPLYASAARTLGAKPWQVFLHVTLPLSMPGILAGAIMGFAKALGEFGATITFVSNIPGQTQTIATRIYSDLQTPSGDAGVLRLTIISVLIAFSAMVASQIFASRMKLKKKLALSASNGQ